MRFTITGRNIEVTKALRNIIEEKLSRLNKFFLDNIEVNVRLRVTKNRHSMEVTIPIKGGTLVRAEVESSDMYANIDEALEVLERQLLKYKTRIKNKVRTDSPFKESFDFASNTEEAEDELKIERSKRFDLKPMFPDEACLEMELLGHDFFVFTNGETGEVNVVYKRKKKDTYGLIEPEA